MRKIATHKIDLKKVSEGFGLSKKDAFDFLNDGRIMGRLGEFIHSNSNGGKRQNENSKFDIIESDNKKSEVRSITDKVSFASSKEIGYGRKVTDEGFEEKLNSIDGYVLLDIRNLSEGVFETIEVTKEDLINLDLGKNKSISAKKFYEYYDRIEQSL
jgi:hypothetical protein